MKQLLLLAVGTAAAVGLGGAAEAQHWRWDTIAVRTVAFGSDTDRVGVNSYGRYRVLRLCAVNAPFYLRDLKVHFHNGSEQDVLARIAIRAGTCSLPIDLRGDERSIKRIRLRYDPIPRSAVRPVVRLQAR